MKRSSSAWIIVLLVLCGLIVCSKDSGTSLQPPSFTNLAGTRWHITDVVSAANTCNVNVGVSDSWTLHIVSQSGNTITFYDERTSSSSVVSGTVSGSTVTYSGDRYPIQGCSKMTASYSVTFNSAGTAFTGTATIICTDGTGCSVPANVTGAKL
jgi:hypothetical protein